jgi:Putative metal-binding motif
MAIAIRRVLEIAMTAPHAIEVCRDGVDNDCNGLTDGEEDTCQAPCATDADGDGASSVHCGGPDCDDTRADVGPLAVELCDGADNDCDGLYDEGFDGDEDDFASCEDSAAAIVKRVSGAPCPSERKTCSDCDDTRFDVSPFGPISCAP